MVINYYYEGLTLKNSGGIIAYNCYDKIDKVVCLSKWHQDNVKKYIHLLKKKYKIIENPINLDFFNKNNFDKESINKKKIDSFTYLI